MSPFLSRSQDHGIKMNFGLAGTSIIHEPKLDSELKTGINIDFSYIRKISPYFFISGGLGFIQNGNISDIILTNENGERLGVAELKWEFDYVNFPIHFGFDYGGNFYFLADLGIQPSFLLKSETKSDDDRFNHDVTDRIDKFDVSGKIRIGVGRYINEKFSSEINLAYQQSLKRTSTGHYQLRHFGFLVNIGISYKLCKS